MADRIRYRLENPAPEIPGSIALTLALDGRCELELREPTGTQYRWVGQTRDPRVLGWLRIFPPSDPAYGAWPLKAPRPCLLEVDANGATRRFGRDFELTQDSRTGQTFHWLDSLIEMISGGMLSLGPALALDFGLETEVAEPAAASIGPVDVIELITEYHVWLAPERAHLRSRAALGQDAWRAIDVDAALWSMLLDAIQRTGFPHFTPRGAPGPTELRLTIAGAPRVISGDAARLRSSRRWGPLVALLEDVIRDATTPPECERTPPQPGRPCEGLVFWARALTPEEAKTTWEREITGAMTVSVHRSTVEVIHVAQDSGVRYRWTAQVTDPTVVAALTGVVASSPARPRFAFGTGLDLVVDGARFSAAMHGLTVPPQALGTLDAIVQTLTRGMLRVDHSGAGSHHRAVAVEQVQHTVEVPPGLDVSPMVPFDELLYELPGSSFHRAPPRSLRVTSNAAVRNGEAFALSAADRAALTEAVRLTGAPLYVPFMPRMLRPDGGLATVRLRAGSRDVTVTLDWNEAASHPIWGAVFALASRLATG
jgi:hypothetical protein